MRCVFLFLFLMNSLVFLGALENNSTQVQRTFLQAGALVPQNNSNEEEAIDSATMSDDQRLSIGVRYRHSTPIIVFDFGGVVGGTDRGLVAKAIAPILGISGQEAEEVMSRLRAAKDLGISQKRFWNEYEATSGRQLPDHWEDYFEEIRLYSIRAKPEMLTLVDDLRLQGYRVAMLSNTTPPRAAFIRRQGFYSHFEPVILSCDIGVKKPHQGAFVTMLNQLQASPSDCLLIDDKLENIEAARRLGMDGIVFSSPEELLREFEKRGILSGAM